MLAVRRCTVRHIYCIYCKADPIPGLELIFSYEIAFSPPPLPLRRAGFSLAIAVSAKRRHHPPLRSPHTPGLGFIVQWLRVRDQTCNFEVRGGGL